jgi:competence protein ComFC
MKCLVCDRFTLAHICNECQDSYLRPSIYQNKISGLDIVSFYEYDEIKTLLHSKYMTIGSSIYSILAKNAFRPFAKNFQYDNRVFSIAIDDRVEDREFSQTAILNQALDSDSISPLTSQLHATNNVKYAEKSFDEKVKSPREFIYNGKRGIDVILVDDVATDGLTLLEARDHLKKYDVRVLFGMVLSYSKR